MHMSLKDLVIEEHDDLEVEFRETYDRRPDPDEDSDLWEKAKENVESKLHEAAKAAREA